jgi:serine/threonine protein kinase
VVSVRFSHILMLLSAWKAPETFVAVDNRRAVSAKADVYMYGCVVLEVITGAEPFYWLSGPGSAVAVIEYRSRERYTKSPLDAAIAEGKLCFIMQDSHCRSELARLASWCFQYSPMDRPDMDQVLDFLKDLQRKCVLPESDPMKLARYHIGDDSLSTPAIQAAMSSMPSMMTPPATHQVRVQYMQCNYYESLMPAILLIACSFSSLVHLLTGSY